MESSWTSMCTTVSDRPVELKPIAASRRSSLLQIFRGFRVVPHKSGAVMNERAIRHE
jgi:hypothetical protein